MGITSIQIRHYWHKYLPSWVKISAHCGIKSALCVILILFLPYPYLISQKPPSSHIYPPFSIKSAFSFCKSAPFSAFYKTNPPRDFNKSALQTNPSFHFNISTSFVSKYLPLHFINPPSHFYIRPQPPNPTSNY